MEKGRRSHEHGMPGDKHHDEHIGGDGGTHLARGVEELHRQHPTGKNMQGKERPEAMQHEKAPRGRSAPPKIAEGKAGVQQHPSAGVGKRHDPED